MCTNILIVGGVNMKIEPPVIVPVQSTIKEVEIQNVDSWSKLNDEDETKPTITENNESESSDNPLWKEFRNQKLQSQQRVCKFFSS